MRSPTKKIRTWANGLPRRGTEYDFDRPLRCRCTTIPGCNSLPIAHVTTVHAARGVVEKAKIVTKPCNVFGIALAYFFVLKPAYLGKFDHEKSDFLDYFPVALILRPDAVPKPHHIYPFDTGAAASGAFRKRANRLVPLEDYELQPTHEGAAGFIGWAFESLSSYYDGVLRNQLSAEIKPADSVTTAYIAIAKLGVPGDPEHDTRATTLELASADNVDLAENVLLAIIPKQMLELPGHFLTSLRLLKDKGTEIKPYDWQPNLAPAEFQRHILRLTREWYASVGIEA